MEVCSGEVRYRKCELQHSSVLNVLCKCSITWQILVAPWKLKTLLHKAQASLNWSRKYIFNRQADVTLKVLSSCMLTHTSQFPSLRSKQEGVLDSVWQNVLGDDGLRYWTLVLLRAGVGFIDRPNRSMYYLRWSSATHVARAERKSRKTPSSAFI